MELEQEVKEGELKIKEHEEEKFQKDSDIVKLEEDLDRKEKEFQDINVKYMLEKKKLDGCKKEVAKK